MLQVFKKYFNHLYRKPTLIQQKVYQPLIQGHDVVGLSPTGSGKTVAFLIPILSRLMPDQIPQILIFEPSQELAIQTAHVTRQWASLIHARVVSLTGGANLRRQKEKLKQHPQVIVGTPGRIQVMVEDRRLKLGHLRIAIIDEADNLLSGDTLQVIRQILNAAPSRVQLGYFSATDQPILHQLKRWFAKDAERIDVRKLDHTRGKVIHGLLRISRPKRNRMLKMLLDVHHFKALVFFNSLKRMNQTYSYFRHSHVHEVAKLAGYQGQVPRAKAMRNFREGRVRLLLTTDIAARGLDIPALPAVINYDLPHREIAYVHRVGRTGRMGHSGLVINFGDQHDFRDLRHLVSSQHYHFAWIYYYRKQILDRTKLRRQLKIVHKSSQSRDSRQASTKKQDYPQKHQTMAKHKLKQRPHLSRRARKHRKRKHSKNKGMRHKWRQRDRQR